MASNDLVDAISLIKEGKKQEALFILKEIIKNEPKNEQAWLWLYSCVNTREQNNIVFNKP
ncbi:MAG: hypothetical protein KF758_15690 [Anaerolineales bacterium]|nr:hypothetical protein [Anaerolineales bacterium]